MIYDCFIFNDEFDLLKIRLKELHEIVDKFVIVENTKTFTKKNKKLHFKENINNFKKFKDKIIHVVVKDSNKAKDVRKLNYYKFFGEEHHNYQAWSIETHQRNCIMRGLKECKKDDIIMISDIDEIPSVSSIKKLKKILNNKENKIISFKQKMYYYYLNTKLETEWFGTKALFYKNLKIPQIVRQSEPKTIIMNGGWHFSYLGGIEKIIKKMNSISHQELNIDKYMNPKRLKFNINNDLDIFDRPYKVKTVNIDSTFPKTIYNKQKKYKRYIKKKNKNSQNTKELRDEVFKLRGEIFNLENKEYITEIKKQNQKIINEMNNSKLWKICSFLKKTLK